MLYSRRTKYRMKQYFMLQVTPYYPTIVLPIWHTYYFRYIMFYVSISRVLLKEKNTKDYDDNILFDPIILKTKHALIPRKDIILNYFVF